MAKAKQVESWGDIPREKFEKFYRAVEKLRDEMIPRDCDGDSPIQMLIVDRTEHEPISYLVVPKSEVYSYVTHGYLRAHPDKQQEMEDDAEAALSANVHMAAEALERHMRLKQHRHQAEREAKRPFPERIAEACELCEKKVGFDTNNNDFYGKTRARYADFPFMYHSDGQRCKAFDLHRAEFRQRHPSYDPQPEPRWCANPDCRCKLLDYDSSKGANDKDICPNPHCRTDNSK